MKQPTDVPTLLEVREKVVADALERFYADGIVKLSPSGPGASFFVLRGELDCASLLAWECADADGPYAGDERLKQVAVGLMDANAADFGHEGIIRGAGLPSPYFTLVPFTRALLSLRGRVDADWHGRMVARGQELFADAAAKIDRTHDYLNPRALESLGCLGLHTLTGEQQYMDRCVECLDELLLRQYACGAQPYHTGMWVWGRKPAQAYQLLSAAMMLCVGRQLQRDAVVEYVRRVIVHSMRATNRRGEAFVTTFEGLHKAGTYQCAGRQWMIATALGDENLQDFAATTYGKWACDAPGKGRDRRGFFGLTALVDALHLGLRETPAGGAFAPAQGVRALPDISAVIAHTGDVDVCMSLLSGYSAFAEGNCGDVKLFALTPELTAEPTYRNAGTDALRAYWQKPSEQIECSAEGGKSVLSGWVYTKWDDLRSKDFRHLHNRRLGVTMTYEDGELVLEYETLKNWQAEPVPSRLLFLLIARPSDASPRLEIGREVDVTAPSATSDDEFFVESPVGVVRFSAPDGSAIEIIPELSTADRVTAERPSRGIQPTANSDRPATRKARIKPANEGSLRVAFDGPDALDRGRYRIRFLPA